MQSPWPLGADSRIQPRCSLSRAGGPHWHVSGPSESLTGRQGLFKLVGRRGPDLFFHSEAAELRRPRAAGACVGPVRVRVPPSQAPSRTLTVGRRGRGPDRDPSLRVTVPGPVCLARVDTGQQMVPSHRDNL